MLRELDCTLNPFKLFRTNLTNANKAKYSMVLRLIPLLTCLLRRRKLRRGGLQAVNRITIHDGRLIDLNVRPRTEINSPLPSVVRSKSSEFAVHSYGV